MADIWLPLVLYGKPLDYKPKALLGAPDVKVNQFDNSAKEIGTSDQHAYHR